MMFIKKSPNSHGFVNPGDIEQMWRDQFNYVCREYDEVLVTITIHPDASGLPQVLLMLGRLASYIETHPGRPTLECGFARSTRLPMTSRAAIPGKEANSP